jgi:hypothetical protein
MTIVLYLGGNVNDYKNNAEKAVKQHMEEGLIRCGICNGQVARHSAYQRGVKETGQKISITIARCKKCGGFHALLPDFLLPHKQYSGNEVESVIIDSGTLPVSQIETEASESTVRRWISQVGERIKAATDALSALFLGKGAAARAALAGAGPAYAELEQILAMAPERVKYSGNKLGLANLWVGGHCRGWFI